MNELLINRISKRRQYLAGFLAVAGVAGICALLGPLIDHHMVSLILLLTVSIIAVSFDILPVLFAAVFSAFVWNFFFIPPRFTLHVSTAEDTILFIMFFVLAMINAVLTFKIRQIEKVARRREEKANAVKLYNTLLNSLSHELRTPISAIMGAADNLVEQDGRLGSAARIELATEISKASIRLNQQVENLLNMSRLDSGFIKPKKDWCDISELVYGVVERVEENSGRKNIHVQIPPDLPLFRTDKGMLEQIVYNLVNNAAVHTGPDVSIEIRCRDHGDQLQIIVEDNGQGFLPQELDNVFDAFYRLQNKKTSGTGLGLSIVKGFTEALKGSVRLENPASGGSRFTIEIPAQTSPVHSHE